MNKLVNKDVRQRYIPSWENNSFYYYECGGVPLENDYYLQKYCLYLKI